jgi:YegS/Rv2252/BmrU family lipid kinase
VRILVFANPIAGRGKGKGLVEGLASRLRHRGHVVTAVLEKSESINPKALANSAPDAAIVIGGDGTLRGVAQTLLDVFAIEQLPPILVVPLGTANLMGRHLGIDWKARGFEAQVASVLEIRRVVHVDVARANGQIFLLMAGVGIDGAVVHELSRVRKGPIDLTSYVLPAALALQAYSYPALRVKVDDRQVFARAPGMAFVGNVSEYGTGFPILPHARSDDGLLDICVLPCRSRPEAINLVLRAAAGEHLGVEGVVYTKGKRVRIESAESIPVQLDGEAAGHTPVEIELLEAKMPFIVP